VRNARARVGSLRSLRSLRFADSSRAHARVHVGANFGNFGHLDPPGPERVGAFGAR